MAEIKEMLYSSCNNFIKKCNNIIIISNCNIDNILKYILENNKNIDIFIVYNKDIIYNNNYNNLLNINIINNLQSNSFIFECIYINNNIIDKTTYKYMSNIINTTLEFSSTMAYYIIENYTNSIRKAILEYLDDNILFPIKIIKDNIAILKKEKFSYNIMHPEISIDTINNYNNSSSDINNIKKYFEVEKIINERSITNSKNKLFSISLFCKNNYNSYENEFNTYIKSYPTEVFTGNNVIDINNKDSIWYNKYVNELKKRVLEIEELCNEWNIRIYLENQLEPLIDEILSYSKNNTIEIYLMKQNSIGASPGTLWRFMAINDTRYEYVIVIDIDETLNYFHIYYDMFTIYKNIALAKVFCHFNGRKYVGYNNLGHKNIHSRNNNDLYIKHYKSVVACKIFTRPNLFKKYDVKDIMIKFIYYFNNVLYNNTNYFEFNTSYDFWINNTWTMYCFDELIFKLTLYPALIKDGVVQNFLYNKCNITTQEIKADIEFIKTNKNNVIINLEDYY